MKACAHGDAVEVPALTRDQKTGLVCADCVAIGSRWVHLRQCRTCGAVSCCDDSPNQHASRHAAETDHPIITSAEPSEIWSWCYVDRAVIDAG